MRVHPGLASLCSVLLLLPPVIAATPVETGSVAPKPATFGQNLKQMQFAPIPGMPTCTRGSVQNGDPSSGPSVIAARAESGCVIPWHWHTPNERLILVAGVAKLEMRDGGSLTLKAGGFALMPTKHVHQFTCVRACTLYVHSDAAFDLHYVNGEGHEIAPDDAMRRFGQTAAKAAG